MNLDINDLDLDELLSDKMEGICKSYSTGIWGKIVYYLRKIGIDYQKERTKFMIEDINIYKDKVNSFYKYFESKKLMFDEKLKENEIKTHHLKKEIENLIRLYEKVLEYSNSGLEYEEKINVLLDLEEIESAKHFAESKLESFCKENEFLTNSKIKIKIILNSLETRLNSINVLLSKPKSYFSFDAMSLFNLFKSINKISKEINSEMQKFEEQDNKALEILSLMPCSTSKETTSYERKRILEIQKKLMNNDRA